MTTDLKAALAEYVTYCERGYALPNKVCADLRTAVGLLEHSYRMFDALARLGNGTEYGNSNGNVMAQSALKRLEAHGIKE